MRAIEVLEKVGLTRVHDIANVIGWPVEEVEQYYDDQTRFLCEIEKDYYENEWPRVQDEVKALIQDIPEEERETHKRNALLDRIDRVKTEFLEACANHYKAQYAPFGGEAALQNLQQLEKELHKLDMDVKILVGKRLGITPEQIAKARQFPLTDLVKNVRGMAKCPFHTDKHPSMDIRKNFYHCYGCNATGDVINFVMKTEGISFREAITKLT